jgi:hypothetical protein
VSGTEPTQRLPVSDAWLIDDSGRVVGHPEVTGRKTQETLESSAIVEAVAIVSQMTFSVPLYLLT